MKLLATCLLFLFFLPMAPCLAQTSSDKPNVLFIVLDDLNDWTGFAEGHPQALTPNMDAMARRGTVFQNAFCSAPVCGPSRTSFLTGKDPAYTQVYSNSGTYTMNKVFRDVFDPVRNNDFVVTLPQYLKDSAGYFTLNFNKIFHGWSNKGFDNDFDSITADPCSKGKSWNYFVDFPSNTDIFPDTPFQFTRFHHGLPNMLFGPLENEKESEMNDTKNVDEVLAFLQDYANNPGNYCDKPFMASVGLYRPHNPFVVPERFFPEYYERDFDLLPYPIPYNNPPDLWPPNGYISPGRPSAAGVDFDHLSSIAKALADGADTMYQIFEKFPLLLNPVPQIALGLDTATRRDIIEEAERNLADMSLLASIHYADYQVGRIFEALEIAGLAENTIIVVFSDNGYAMREHQHYKKSGLWDTDIRVPLFISAPGRPAFQESTRAVSLIDLFPTLLDLLELPEPVFPDGSRYLDGHSIAPLLQNPQAPFERPVLSSIQMLPFYREGKCFPSYSVRSDRWHYIRYQTDGSTSGCDSLASLIFEELYELGVDKEIDPNELNNLADDPVYSTIKDYLKQWLPDGRFYNKISPQASMQWAPEKCLYKPTDTLQLQAIYQDETGTPAAIPTNFEITWRFQPGGITATGPNLSAPLSLLDTSLLGANDHFTITLELRDTLDPSHLLADLQSLPFSASGPPTASFSAAIDSLDGKMVSITSFKDLKGSTNLWDYGDGFKYSGPKPASHRYTAPGNYRIERILSLPGSAACTLTSDTLINIPVTAFSPTDCAAPAAISIDPVGISKAAVDFEDVYNAVGYNLRIQELQNSLDSSSWVNFPLTASDHFLSSLQSDKTYQLQLSSNCPASTSDWSYPVQFTTQACTAPALAEISQFDSSMIEFSWIPGVGQIDAQFFGFKPIGGGPKLLFSYLPTETDALINSSTSGFSGFTPGQKYIFGAASQCQQFDGSTIRSKVNRFPNLNTPTSRLAHDFAAINIYPNPSHATATIAGQLIRKDSGNSTRIELEVIEISTGQVIVRKTFRTKTERFSESIDVSEVPQGFYLVRLTNVDSQRYTLEKMAVIR